MRLDLIDTDMLCTQGRGCKQAEALRTSRNRQGKETGTSREAGEMRRGQKKARHTSTGSANTDSSFLRRKNGMQQARVLPTTMRSAARDRPREIPTGRQQAKTVDAEKDSANSHSSAGTGSFAACGWGQTLKTRGQTIQRTDCRYGQGGGELRSANRQSMFSQRNASQTEAGA